MNHNETLLMPARPKPPGQFHYGRRRLVMSALVVASIGAAVGFVNDGTSNTRHHALAGQYCTSSGGGGDRTCPQRP